MNLKKGQILELKIESLNIKGQGIAFLELEGQKYNVAINRSFPGDIVTAKIFKIKKNFLEASLEEIIQASPDRVPAINSYASIAGSTPLELLDYSKQLYYKEQEVYRILNNLNLQSKINPIIGMQEPIYYRNKMQYSFGITPDVFEFCLGMHHYKYRFKIVPATDCKLCDPLCSPIVNFSLEFFKNSGLNPHDFRNGEGDLRNLTLRFAKNTSDKMLVLEVQKNQDSSIQQIYQNYFQEIQSKFPDINSIFLHETLQKKGQRTKVELTHISGKTSITEELNINNKTFEFDILPQAFFQPNTIQAEVIYGLVENLVSATDVIYDLFCGTGTIGLVISHKAKNVIGIEIEPQAIEIAKLNASKNQITNIKFLEGDVYKTLQSQNLSKPDVVIVDPPRSGLTDKALELIVQLQPQEIIYVSCNIKTFSQNAVFLEERGYKLEVVTPVDQFPHTRHLELVSKFTFQK